MNSAHRFALAAVLAVLSAFGAEVEKGVLNGAAYRISRPAAWNGILILYCHGYNPAPVTYEADTPNPLMDTLLAAGYAVAESGYAAGGWAIAEAEQDTEAVRRYFVRKYGLPKATYVTGHSMGGFLTMLLVERHPDAYMGGLALCGPLAPAAYFMERQVFDARVVFDYYFPNALPSPARVPADFQRTPEKAAQIEALLEAKPAAAESLRRFSHIRNNKELAATMVFWTYVLKDLQRRGGGNPFDNRNTIYEGTAEDNAVNDGVARYAAEPQAAEYIRTYYTPTGRLSRPLLAIHTTYDQLVPASVPNQYVLLAGQAGASRWFVQQYVKRAGHCAILPAEVQRGLSDLRKWKEEGTGPKGGAVP